MQGKQTTFRGILIPTDWDDNGKVTAIGLSGTDEKQYLIGKNEKLGELLGLIRREIEIIGPLLERAGRKVILTKRYRLISREPNGSFWNS